MDSWPMTTDKKLIDSHQLFGKLNMQIMAGFVGEEVSYRKISQ